MAADDKETKAPAPAPPPALTPRVERALSRAREAAKADNARKEGRWLAAIPLTVGVVFFLLIMPRGTAPDAVPLPRADQRVVRSAANADDARAAAAEAQRLPTDVLAVGTAVRAVNRAEEVTDDQAALVDARRTLESAMRDLKPRPHLEEDMLSLRALQTRHFLDAITHWEATGEKTDDLRDLAGSFVERNEEAGWVENRHLAMSDAQRRIAFKIVWNALVGVDKLDTFAVSLDEQRELYTFYLQHPRIAETYRLAMEAQVQAAKTPEACKTANLEVAHQKELWRADKIKRLGAIDPTYPTGYALGVAYYRAGRFDLASESFTAYVGEHPDGPYALRAKNHLRASVVARW